MTDEAPPGRRRSRYQPSAQEADLDAALWPTPARPAPDVVIPVDAPAWRRPEQPATSPSRIARDQVRAERARRARRQRRIRRAAVSAGVVAVIVAAVAVGLVIHAETTKASFGYTGPYAPVTLNADNSVTMAKRGVSRPVLDVYEDFLCSACAAFENANGGMIQRLAEQGKVAVVYYPFTISMDQPQQASSIRAWAAAKCAPANRWARFHNALYAQSAGMTAAGFQISALVRLGKEVGIANPGFAQCVRSQQYAPQDPPLSDQIMNGGVSSALVLKLNGRVLNIDPTSPQLRQRILTAR